MRPSLRARMLASSTGVAVTSQTRCPAAQMALGEFPRALPDPVGHRVVVDLLAERDDVSDLVPGHEGQRGLPGGVDVVGVLGAAQPERHLAPGHPGQVPGPEHLAGGEAAGEVVDRGAAHHRVVDVEERPGRRIGHRRRLLHVGGRRGGLAGHRRAARPCAFLAAVSSHRAYRRGPGRMAVRAGDSRPGSAAPHEAWSAVWSHHCPASGTIVTMSISLPGGGAGLPRRRGGHRPAHRQVPAGTERGRGGLDGRPVRAGRLAGRADRRPRHQLRAGGVPRDGDRGRRHRAARTRGRPDRGGRPQRSRQVRRAARAARGRLRVPGDPGQRPAGRDSIQQGVAAIRGSTTRSSRIRSSRI